MSLLLEALKKAELAKQHAAAVEESDARDAAVDRATPVITREKLPDISQPVEILTDDLPSAGQKTSPAQTEPAARPARIELAIAPEPEPSRAAPATFPAQQSPDAAKRLFEVKEMDYNPRRPFYLTLVALGVAGIGYGGYVWWQLQPKSTFNPVALHDSQPQAAERIPLQAPLPPSTAPVAAATVAQTMPPASPLGQAATESSLPSHPLPPRRTALAPGARRNPERVSLRRDPAAFGAPVPNPEARAGRESIAITPATMLVDPQLERAYEAMQRNDLATAREIYQSLLQREPNHRDALLGLAAIDVKLGNYDIAEARYLRLLDLDPRDSYAQTGLLALRGQLDPIASESRIKNLLASQPDSPQLQFALGNQYALQSRWSDAQQAYFRAFAADPENADYAFNLAVSLDHLRQRGPALEYYRRSLALAERRPGSFDRSQAGARVEELQK